MDKELSLRTVNAVAPAAPWLGGKKQLAARIVELIERVPHDTYAEPFVGMGGVFLRRRRIPKGEVINDRSGDVATFFRILQRHYDAFMDELRWQLHEPRGLRAPAAGGPLDADRPGACRSISLPAAHRIRRQGRGPQFRRGRRWAAGSTSPSSSRCWRRCTSGSPASRSNACRGRSSSSGTTRPGTLFYLDPPYWGGEGDYGAGLFRAVGLC